MVKRQKQKPTGNQMEPVSDAAKNGVNDPGDVIIATVKDTEKELSALDLTTADITKNKKRIIQLERADREWQAIFDATEDFIFISDIDYKITKANRAFANALKMEPQAVIGKRCYELLHKTLEPPFSCSHRKTLNSKKSSLEERYETSLGLYLDEGTSPIFAENGKMTHCLHIIRDVTKKRLAEEAEKESKEQLESALRATQDGMWDWNIETNDIWYSPRWLQMFGYSAGEIEANARSWARLLHPEDAKRVRKMVYAVLRGEDAYHIEFRLRHKDGHYLDIYTRGESIRRVPGGPVVRIVGTYFDFTERKRFESELQRLYQNEVELRHKLEKEMRKRVNFTNILVHELKNPLTPVVTCSEMLVRYLQEGIQLRLAKNIYSGATELDQRVDELLELARIEVGTLKLKPQVVDVLNLIQKTLNLMTPQALSKKQKISSHLPKSLPMIKADASRIKQVLMNLIGNALKYTPTKSEIIISAGKRENNIIVEVSDNGPGISEEAIKHIFEPYFQTENRENLGGLGLGLPIAWSIIELHGGHIWVKSKVGEGSTFSFSLPITGSYGNKEGTGDNDENINH
jgi:PAS domain S-box-containing protein